MSFEVNSTIIITIVMNNNMCELHNITSHTHTRGHTHPYIHVHNTYTKTYIHSLNSPPLTLYHRRNPHHNNLYYPRVCTCNKMGHIYIYKYKLYFYWNKIKRISLINFFLILLVRKYKNSTLCGNSPL